MLLEAYTSGRSGSNLLSVTERRITAAGYIIHTDGLGENWEMGKRSGTRL